MTTLKGIMGRVALPLVTPFHANEDVNHEALANLADFALRRGYGDSIISTGTTGEFYSLTDDERIEVWKTTKAAINGRAPLVISVGAASTRATLKLTEQAEALGCDVIMVVLPYYSKPTQEGVFEHFRAVASATSLPVLIYNIPLFTGINMEADTLVRLAEIPNIRGVKEEAGIQPTQATAFALRTPETFSIYCGDDTMVLQVLPQRGVGVVSGGSQVIGKWMKRMIAAYEAGDNKLASSLYFSLAPFFAALNQNGRVNPIPILRAAIEMQSGIPIGPPRRPQTAATPAECEVIREILNALFSGDPAA